MACLTEAAYDIAKGDEGAGLTRGALLLRDTLVFLALLLITVVLFGVTYFLFRSFESHREDLAHDWAARGQAALQHGQPATAVSSLRAALSYDPDDHANQLLLAEALAASGRTEEANNYFLNLWSARPGDGFINLQLARLARRRGETQQAIEYYRAAIYGDWQGDGLERRRDVRLELAAYFAQGDDISAARTELLILAGNAPDNAPLDLLIGDKLMGIGDPADAMTYYSRALAANPHSYTALAKAGMAAYGMNNFETAHTLLSRAERQKSEAPEARTPQARTPEARTPEARTPQAPQTPETRAPQLAAQVSTLAHNADRLLELSVSRELPAAERARHIRSAAAIAQARLNNCIAQATPPGAPAALPTLTARWKASVSSASMAHLTTDATEQDTVAQLIFDTEMQTAAVCRPPGPSDDDLLLLLARNAHDTAAAATAAAGGATP